MKTVDRWRWMLWDEVRRTRRPSRWHMTEADAMAMDPGAERVPGSHQVLQVPESAAEHQLTSAWRGPSPER